MRQARSPANRTSRRGACERASAAVEVRSVRRSRLRRGKRAGASSTPSSNIVADLSAQTRASLFETLHRRFERHPGRHDGIEWSDVEARLSSKSGKLWALSEMERTGGEPDVIGHDRDTDTYLFVDCVKQSPKGRRSVCYDAEALEARKKHKPENSAVAMASDMGIELLTEQDYEMLQKLGEFDTTTSSWLLTPRDVRDRGGAIFGDRRFGRVFVYHNGAESYYAARGFRGKLTV